MLLGVERSQKPNRREQIELIDLVLLLVSGRF
jgi:hypothetical protein